MTTNEQLAIIGRAVRASDIRTARAVKARKATRKAAAARKAAAR